MQIIDETNPSAAALASEFLRAGKIISFATDTIYGIAVDASNYNAVAALYNIKKRDPKKPIAIFLPNLETAKEVFYFDEVTKNIAEKFLPGALTLVLKTKSNALKSLASNLNQNNDDFIGFRIVDKIFINDLFKKFNGILAVSSANLSNENPLNNSEEIAKKIPDIDLLIKGKTSSKIASTVVKIFDGKITVLRDGPIKLI